MDQVVDAATGRGLHANARAAHALLAWVVTRDPPQYPGRLVARLVTEAPSSYVLLADTLAGLHAQLPPHLARSARQPAGPPGRGLLATGPRGCNSDSSNRAPRAPCQVSTATDPTTPGAKTSGLA